MAKTNGGAKRAWRVRLGLGLIFVAGIAVACSDNSTTSDGGSAGNGGTTGGSAGTTSGGQVGAGASAKGGSSGSESTAGSAGKGGGTGGNAGNAGSGETGGESIAGAGGIEATGGVEAGGAGGANSGLGGVESGGAAGNPAGGEGGSGQVGQKACSTALCDDVVGKPSDFGNAWRSGWFISGCLEKDLHLCRPVVGACPDGGIEIVETFPIGGEVGKRYKVTFSFNAIAEAKQYSDGTRDQGTSTPASPDTAVWDTFYRDGTAPATNYNAWRLSVLDENSAEKRHYYMNAFPDLSWESHRTFLIGFTKSIVVLGGGKVTHTIHDQNCTAVDNCNAGYVDGNTCTMPRNIPNEPADVALPAMYWDVNTSTLKPTQQLSIFNATQTQPWHSQLGHLTVLDVVETSDPVTQDYP